MLEEDTLLNKPAWFTSVLSRF